MCWLNSPLTWPKIGKICRHNNKSVSTTIPRSLITSAAPNLSSEFVVPSISAIIHSVLLMLQHPFLSLPWLLPSISLLHLLIHVYPWLPRLVYLRVSIFVQSPVGSGTSQKYVVYAKDWCKLLLIYGCLFYCCISCSHLLDVWSTIQTHQVPLLCAPIYWHFLYMHVAC